MQQFPATHAWCIQIDEHPHTGSKQQWNTTDRRLEGPDIFKSFKTSW